MDIATEQQELRQKEQEKIKEKHPNKEQKSVGSSKVDSLV